MNNSDTEFIAEEEITQAASTQDNTPEANLYVVPRDNQSKKKEKNKKEELWNWTKNVKVTKQEECHLVPEIQPNLNEYFPHINIFFGNWSKRAARIDSWTIKLLCSSEWKKLYSYQGRTESISWKNFVVAINKLPTIAEYWRVI